MEEELEAIVVDWGDALCRCGIAGEDDPKLICPTVVGSGCFGDEAISQRFTSPPREILSRGVVQDWEVAEDFLRDCFQKIHADSKGRAILFNEPHFSAVSHFQKLQQMAFETFDFDGFATYPDTVLPAVSSGRWGVSVVLGESSIQIAPMYEGRCVDQGVRRYYFGGSDLTAALLDELTETGHSVEHSSFCDRWMVKDLKEKALYIAADYENALRTETGATFMCLPRGAVGTKKVLKKAPAPVQSDNFGFSAPAENEFGGGTTVDDDYSFGIPQQPAEQSFSFDIPQATEVEETTVPADVGPVEGEEIKLTTERIRVAELLFNPKLLGHEFGGLDELIFQSVRRAPIDTRKEMMRSVIVCGGTSRIDGLVGRLKSGLLARAPSSMKVGICLLDGPSAWVGGSIVASLSTMKWLSREEYDENGASTSRAQFGMEFSHRFNM